MSLRLAINGACGRMGLAVARLALQDKALTLSAPIEHEGHPHMGEDYGTLVGDGPIGVVVANRLELASDVLIDFSGPEGAAARAPECAAHGVAMVVGTTGLDPDATAALEKAARKVPVVAASNMSLGMNLVFRLAEQIARSLDEAFDIEIVETHHHNKKDAPSGSALTLMRNVARGRGRNPDKDVVYGRQGLAGRRPKGQIAVHALRGGDVVGEHVVSFISEGETVEIVHKARTRDIFARGALHAARRIHGRKPGMVDIADLLKA